MAGKNSKEGNAPSGFGNMPSKTVSARTGESVMSSKLTTTMPLQGTQAAFRSAHTNNKKA